METKDTHTHSHRYALRTFIKPRESNLLEFPFISAGTWPLASMLFEIVHLCSWVLTSNSLTFHYSIYTMSKIMNCLWCKCCLPKKNTWLLWVGHQCITRWCSYGPYQQGLTTNWTKLASQTLTSPNAHTRAQTRTNWWVNSWIMFGLQR